MAMVRETTQAYHYGLPGVEKDSDAALVWGRRAATSGKPIALAALAYLLEESEDTRAEAAALYLKAAEGGYHDVFYATGFYYGGGRRPSS